MPGETHLSHVPDALHGLVELALDLRFSWTRASEELWSRLDPRLWDVTRNPWLLLQIAPKAKLDELAGDPEFLALLESNLEAHRREERAPRWFEERHGRAPLRCVAYFSMEFGLSEALPIYSGGLGILAGDHLKSVSDLGVPLIGIGLLYQRGYFRQAMSPAGEQVELYPYNEPVQLPVTRTRASDGTWLRVPTNPPGRTIWLRVWEARVGRVKLYLLDSNDPLNPPADRGITSELYGGGSELRFQQELALAIGGWRLLEQLGVRPEVCHLNEGHAAFVVIARAATFMREHRVPFATALTATRAGNVFTTHTPVAAGFDRFEPALARLYLSAWSSVLRVPADTLLALGRLDPTDESEPFHMAYLALRGCGAANGVSRLHGEVSRRLFARSFPRWPVAEVPIGHVTNGVHVPTWQSSEIDRLLEETGGERRWSGTTSGFEDQIRQVSDDALWACRGRERARLVQFVRTRLALQRGAAGASPEEIAESSHYFDPDALTLGFARRFATYKRPTLLLRDPARLVRLLTSSERPVQLVVAGKAHPHDGPGKSLIHAWSEFVQRPELRGRVAFLSDYDMLVAGRLVQGVDVWLNTPRPPYEASGTSGMKVLVNGGLNLSSLDGWWAEAHAPEVGYALGDGLQRGDEGDAADAESLYRVLEQDIVPAFYERDGAGLPRRWIARVRESMLRLTPRFSGDRMVREYVEKLYLPAAAAYVRRSADQGKLAAAIEAWRERLALGWQHLFVSNVEVTSDEASHRVRAEVGLGALSPEDVVVELYADGASGGAFVRLAMEPEGPGQDGSYWYSCRVAAARPASDFTVRIVPRHDEASVPLEESRIYWSR